MYKPATRNKIFTKHIPFSNNLREKMLIKGKKCTFSEKENNEKQRDALRRQIGILP